MSERFKVGERVLVTENNRPPFQATVVGHYEPISGIGYRLVRDGYTAEELWHSSWVSTLTSTEPLDGTNPKDLIGVRKPQLDKVPPAAIIHLAKAMENGAAKYGPFNWREKKVKSSVYLAAAQRHILSWADGEDVAEDSGVHHLAHAAACLAILLDAEATESLVDDRPTPGVAARLIAKLTEER